MGKTKQAENTLLQALGASPKSKKELKKTIKAKNPTLKKHLKKALRKLEERGEIKSDGKVYQVISFSAEKNVKDDKEDKPLPIAMQLRKTNASVAEKKSVKFSEPEVDLDEEIRRLQQELEESGSSDGSDSDDDDEGSAKPAVLSLSEFAQDRVEQLPESYLPEPGRYNPRASRDPHAKSKKSPREQKKIDGLREAVQEVLGGYKARSSEKLPFYCRFCAKQYTNEDEFFDHKQTEFHKTAVAMEKRATYCRLCIKQLTSPAQMKEHLASRPHKERLQNVRNRQQAVKSREAGSKRQWA
jgi:hypothetical protein